MLDKVQGLVSLKADAEEFNAASAWILEVVAKLDPNFMENSEASSICNVFSSNVLSLGTRINKSDTAHVARLWSVMMAADESGIVSFKQYLLLFTAVILATHKTDKANSFEAFSYDTWDIPAAIQATNKLIAKINSGEIEEIELF